MTIILLLIITQLEEVYAQEDALDHEDAEIVRVAAEIKRLLDASS